MSETGIVNIHGKEYRTVAYRVDLFRENHKLEDGWTIQTNIVSNNPPFIVVKAEILHEGNVVACGHAEEDRNKPGINRTSALENCETSAIGRALASAGFGGGEFASADEVANAVHQQNQPNNGKAPAKPQGIIDDDFRERLGKLTKDDSATLWTKTQKINDALGKGSVTAAQHSQFVGVVMGLFLKRAKSTDEVDEAITRLKHHHPAKSEPGYHSIKADTYQQLYASALQKRSGFNARGTMALWQGSNDSLERYKAILGDYWEETLEFVRENEAKQNVDKTPEPAPNGVV